MAQKFGNGRWVRDGFLDNRTPGLVVGQLYVACIGVADVCLRGDLKADIQGQMVVLRNGRYEDDDMAGHVLGDFELPQVGTVSLISFDPHPLLAPHPYIEWFSERGNHYRLELGAGDAWIATGEELQQWDTESRRIRETLSGRVLAMTRGRKDSDSEWV